MFKPLRFGTALTAIAMISGATGCSSPGSNRARSASIFGGKVDTSNIGLATRAQIAFVAEDYRSAVTLAERAVEASPNDAGFRALLGNIYFASGRFASAQSAYRDSLTLVSNQPSVVLKLVLVDIALGNYGEALSLLEAARGAIDSSDYGLALALAGQPGEAIAVLEPAARMVGADSRVRQNLALAYAFSGDWTAARTIAAQDVPAEQLDARLQQWMQLAKPARASDQVAALIGVTPVADTGQPARLALKDGGSKLAALAPTPQPQPAPMFVTAQPAPVVAIAPQPAPIPVSEPVETAMLAPQPAPQVTLEAAPAAIPLSWPSKVAVVNLAPPARIARAPRAAPLPRKAAPGLRTAGFRPERFLPLRRAALTRSVNSVVQLAAYHNGAYVTPGWSKLSRRYAHLRSYTPVTARFASPRGMVYRLAVKGFASSQEANNLCLSLRRAGGNCFVRTVAGDAPVRIASL